MRPNPRRLLTALALVAATAAAAAPAAQAKVARTYHMYNDRYCEYLMVKGTFPNALVADVWNTYGLNDCPDAWWKASDPKALATQFGALTVKVNGPRYWLMDRASIKIAPGLRKVQSFSGVKMRRIAQVKVPVTNGVPGLAAYTPVTVLRANTFTWSKRNPVHELVAPDGHVYLMQAYSQIKDPTLSLGALKGLGPRLALPAGWTYRTRRLKRDLSLTTTGKAVVVQDVLENTYQRER